MSLFTSGRDEPITINPTSDLVTFDDIPSYYVPGEDIFVIYQLGSEFKPTSRDWVGLFPCGWGNLSKYITFQWSPKVPRNVKFPNIRSVMFMGKDVQVNPSSEDKYQFLYISKQHVVGVSRSFAFSEFSPDDLTCSDQNLGAIGPVTFIESTDDQQAGFLNNYDMLVNFSSESDSDSDLPPLLDVNEDHFTLAKDAPAVSKPFEISPPKPEPDNNTEWSLVPDQAAVVPFKHTPVPIFCTTAKELEDELLRPISTVNTPSPLKDRVPKGAGGGFPISVVSKSNSDEVFNDFIRLLNSLSVNPGPARPLENMAVVDNPCRVVKKRPTCRGCRQKVVLLAEAKCKNSSLEKERSGVKKELHELQEDMDLKVLLLDELAKQIKNLISENTLLVTMKEKLLREADWWECSSCKKKQDLSSNLETIRSRNKHLENQNRELESRLKDLQEERKQLSKELDALKCQQHDLGKKYSSLEEHLSDIMFTLSTKGVEKIVDRNGNVTSLDMTSGLLLDLDGWEVAMPKKTGKHLATIAAKNEIISDLRISLNQLDSDNRSLNKDIEVLKREAKDIRSERKHLKNELDFLKRDLLEAKNQEESLSTMLGAERKKKTNLIKQHKDVEQELRKRIECLTAALEVAKLGSKDTKDQASETVKTQTILTPCQAECVNVDTKSSQTTRKESTNKVRDEALQPEIPVPLPLAVQLPPLTWYEFPLDLTSFVPADPVVKQPCQETCPQPCQETCPQTPQEERPIRPLWPFCKSKDAEDRTEKPERESSFKPLWLESFLFPSNTTKVEGQNTEKISKHAKEGGESRKKTLKFAVNPRSEDKKNKTEITLDISKQCTWPKNQKTRYSGKTRKAKKAEFSRLLREDEPRPYETDSVRGPLLTPRDAVDDFVCPFCGYFFPSGTPQLSIDRHLRFHSKLSSHFS